MEKIHDFKMFRKAFPFIILSLLILLCLFVGYFRSGFISDMKDTDDTNGNISELEWTFVKAVISEDYLAAGLQAKVVAEDIRGKIENEYPDLSKMRYELEHPQEDETPEYLKIIRDSVHGVYLHNIRDDENDIFVCTKDGILMDVSPSTADELKDWESIYARSSNPTLAKNAVTLLFNRSTDMIYWEHSQLLYLDEVDFPPLSSNPSIEELRSVYMQYGIEGLKHVQFLAPAYITDTGDIFGVEDISAWGTKTNNHKIVVVQTFNPYEQLMTRHFGELEKFNTFKTKMIGEHKTMLIEHALIVVIAVILIVIITYFMMVFNNVIFHSKESHHSKGERTMSKE